MATPLNRAWPGVTIAQEGAFLQARRPVGGVTLTGTARVDLVQTDADDPTRPFLRNAGVTEAQLAQQDASLGGALTASVPLTEQWSLSVGLGSTTRPPSAPERYADRFPASKSQTSAEFQGDPTLNLKRSTQADLWVDGGGAGWTLRLSGFARHLDNYITLRPTDIDPILPLSPPTVFRYVNGEANFVDAEVDATVTLAEPLVARATGSWLWGRDETVGEPAFGVAPPSATLGLRWRLSFSPRWVSGARLDGSARLVGGQDRTAQTRGESATEGYVTVGLRAGARLWDRAELKVGVRNLFDVAYANHLNAKNPFDGTRVLEPGRVLSTTLTVPF